MQEGTHILGLVGEQVDELVVVEFEHVAVDLGVLPRPVLLRQFEESVEGPRGDAGPLLRATVLDYHRSGKGLQ